MFFDVWKHVLHTNLFSTHLARWLLSNRTFLFFIYFEKKKLFPIWERPDWLTFYVSETINTCARASCSSRNNSLSKRCINLHFYLGDVFFSIITIHQFGSMRFFFSPFQFRETSIASCDFRFACMLIIWSFKCVST